MSDQTRPEDFEPEAETRPEEEITVEELAAEAEAQGTPTSDEAP